MYITNTPQPQGNRLESDDFQRVLQTISSLFNYSNSKLDTISNSQEIDASELYDLKSIVRSFEEQNIRLLYILLFLVALILIINIILFFRRN